MYQGEWYGIPGKNQLEKKMVQTSAEGTHCLSRIFQVSAIQSNLKPLNSVKVTYFRGLLILAILSKIAKMCTSKMYKTEKSPVYKCTAYVIIVITAWWTSLHV